MSITVVKRNGEREPYDANKINLAIEHAAQGLDDNITWVTQIASELELVPPEDWDLSDDEAEEIVRTTAAVLTDGSIQVASLHYVDPLRFGIDDPSLAAGIGLAASARIIPQNMSVASRQEQESSEAPVFQEDLLEVSSNEDIGEVLGSTGYALSSSMALTRAASFMALTRTHSE